MPKSGKGKGFMDLSSRRPIRNAPECVRKSDTSPSAGLGTRLLLLNKPYGVLCQFTDRSQPPRPTLAGFGQTSFFLSRQTLLPSSKPGMAIWREKLFAWMLRNAASAMAFFRLPTNRVVELGSQVEI